MPTIKVYLIVAMPDLKNELEQAPVLNEEATLP
jgi:hypothetical protein